MTSAPSRKPAVAETPRSRIASILVFALIVALAVVVHAVGSVNQAAFVYGGL
jgi:hypothetical protein